MRIEAASLSYKLSKWLQIGVEANKNVLPINQFKPFLTG